MKRFAVGVAVGGVLATAGTAGAIAVSDYVLRKGDTVQLQGTDVYCTNEKVSKTDAFACFVLAGGKGKARSFNALISEKGVIVSKFNAKGKSTVVKAYNNP